MSASPTALVQKVRNPFFHQNERRNTERHIVSLEATSHTADGNESISFGAVVHDISGSGMGLTLCYPFRPGTYLAVDIPTLSGTLRSMMVRVVRVEDQRDGMWRLGCEFVKPLSESDLNVIV